jgi:hypothetical protein
MTNTNEIARRYFNAKTVRALGKRGVRVIGATWLPGTDGSFANGQTGICLDNNGTHEIRSYLEVLGMAA